MREAVDELAKLPSPFLRAFLNRGAAVTAETVPPGDGPRFRDLHPWMQAHVRQQVRARRKEVLRRLKEMRDRATPDGSHNGDRWDEVTMGAARDLVRLANSRWAARDTDAFRADLRERFLRAAPQDAQWAKAADKWSEAVRHYGGAGEPLAGNRWLGPCPIPLPDPRTVDDRRAAEASIAEDFGEAPLEEWKAGLTTPQLEQLARRLDAEAVDAALRRRDGRARPAFADALLDLDAIAGLPGPQPLVDGLLYRSTFALLAAPSGTGKTALLTHVGLAAACGQPMHGRQTAKARVLMIAAEGASGLGQRVAAAREAWGYAPTSGDFTVYPAALDVSDPRAVEEAAAVIAAGGYDLLIVDTLNATAGDLDENSATAMGQYVAGLRRLVRDVAGAAVIVAHHTGKSSGEYRGSSALFAAADTVLQMTGDATAWKLELKKQKDGPAGLVGHFTTKPAHGSVIVEGILRSTAEETLRSGATNAEQVLDLFRDTFSAIGATKTELAHVAMERLALTKGSAYRAINELVQRTTLTQDERTKRLTLTPTLD